MTIQMGTTAQVVAEMADELRRRATELDRVAAEMLAENDPTAAVQALMTALNLANLRLDKLILLPMNQMQREIDSRKVQLENTPSMD